MDASDEFFGDVISLERPWETMWEFFSIIDMKRVWFASAAQHAVLATSVGTH